MTGSPYSPLKVFHHRAKLDQLRSGEQITPCQVQLILSDLCNQNCGFCAYRWDGYSSNQLFTAGAKLSSYGHNNPVRYLPYTKVLEILDDCCELGIPAIQLTGGGEPTVHPNFLDILQAIQERELELALVTNGVNLRPESIAYLAQAKWVRISIDAGSQETYCRIRNVKAHHWERVWANLELLRRNKQLSCSDVVIGIGFVITKDNWKEITACAELAKSVGADNIRISAVFQDEGDGYFDWFYREAKELCREAKDMQDGRFHVFDLFGERIEDLHQHSPDYQFCGTQQFVTYIGGDMNVYRCCVLAYNEHGLLGSIKDQRFADLWRSEEKRKKIAGFNAQSCPKCMFNSKNRTILYAIEPKPRHVNFV